MNCTAQRCTALCSVALHCTTLHCTALHYTALHCTALHCTTLHCTVLHCTALHCTSRCYYTHTSRESVSSVCGIFLNMASLLCIVGELSLGTGDRCQMRHYISGANSVKMHFHGEKEDKNPAHLKLFRFHKTFLELLSFEKTKISFVRLNALVSYSFNLIQYFNKF